MDTRKFNNYRLSQIRPGRTDPFQLAFYQGNDLKKLVTMFCELISIDDVTRCARTVVKQDILAHDLFQGSDGCWLINVFCTKVSNDASSTKNTKVAAQKLKEALSVLPRQIPRTLGITGWYGANCKTWILAFVAETYVNPWADSLLREVGRRLWLILRDIGNGVGPSGAAVHLGISSNKRGPRKSNRSIGIDIRSAMLVNHYRFTRQITVEKAVAKVSELKEGIGSEETIWKSYKRQKTRERYHESFTCPGDLIATTLGIYQPKHKDIGIQRVNDFESEKDDELRDESIQVLVAGIRKRRLQRKY